MADFSVYRGDTFRRRITLRRPDGSPVDLTGAVLRFTLKEHIEDEDSAAKVGPLTATMIDAAGGVAEILIPAEAMRLTPGAYAYDFELTGSNGDVQTLRAGELEILQDVTRGA